MTLPLADVRILAVEQFGAGPWGTLQLADLGAEIVKLEDPVSAGDVGRYVPPFQEGEDSLFFETFNRGKKSISLDLRHPDAEEVLHDLVRVCDGVYSNLRGDQPRKLGLTYEQLREANRRRAGSRSSISPAATPRRSRSWRESGAPAGTAWGATAMSRCSRRPCTS
jgi:crotonobetainyl-CoA:carnitine CoA-transferase CaiB-like acyl-CoA transferase